MQTRRLYNSQPSGMVRGPRWDREGGARRMDRQHIVVVEDETTQRELLVEYLGRQNFRVSGAPDGAAFRELIARDPPILVLLDIRLPDEDGLTIARWLRQTNAQVGIIMVTAAADTVDRVVGLEIGADDY